MARRTWLALGLVLLAMLVFAFPAIAGAAPFTNTQCLSCHPAQDFDVTPLVDFSTACQKCHVPTLVGTHPYHNQVGNCGAVCHAGWGDSLGSNVPYYSDAQGAFSSLASKTTSATQLHIIHSTPRWPAGISTANSKCVSCHAVASCSACHTAPDTTHSNHGSLVTTAALTPWSGTYSVGVSGGNQTVTTSVSGQIRCGASGCHNITGVQSAAPGKLDNFSHTAYPQYGMLANTVTKSGSWITKYASVYTGGQEAYSNSSAAYLQTTFTGTKVTLIADVDPYRGIGEVLIDGVSAGTVDLYNAVTYQQREVWTSGDLTAGSHTIRVRPTGGANGASRGTWVTVDQFKVYGSYSSTISPNCYSCHPDRANPHGTATTFSHVATLTAAATYNGGTGAYRCDSCHKMEVRGEHARTSSSVSTGGCATCHETYAPYSWTATWPAKDATNACSSYGTCHSSAPRVAHTNIATAHAVTSDPAEKICRDCHTGDLGTIHNNSITTNAWVTNCNTCHSPTTFPTTKSCTDAACHAVSGVTSITAHPFLPVPHTATPWISASQGGTTTVDAGGKECSLCHAARLDTAHATTSIGAVSCSSGGTGNTGCHLNTSLNSQSVIAGNWSTDQCTQCHNYSSNRSHDDTVTPHFVASNGCAGSACHTSNDLWKIHAKSYNGGAPKYLSCANAGCHDASNVGKRPNIKGCGEGSSGCHTDKNLTNHPSSHDHTYSSASDYNATTETGCANSGANCHGTDATRLDVASTYHPRTTCVGACHSSASKATYGGSNECVTCHDSNYTGAPDRVALTGVYPNGHYNETTHTATGTNFAATVSAGGSASATCTNCHNPANGAGPQGLYNQHQNVTPAAGSPYGSSIACGECHNDTRTGGSIESTGPANWTNNKCEDCHQSGKGSAPAIMHSTVAPSVDDTQTTSCGATGANCHSSKDLHYVHRNASGGCNLSGCHSYSAQANVPTGKSCGAGGSCHTGYTLATSFPTHTKSVETTDHAPSTGNTAQEAATWTVGGSTLTCGACHLVTKTDGGLLTEHSLSSSAMTTNGTNVCRNCHNNPAAAVATAISTGWAANKDTSSACLQCHTAAAGLGIHADQATAKHTIATNTGCGNTGAGCHPTNDLSQVGTPSTTANIHSTCLRCHDHTASGGNMAYNPANTGCGSGRNCHATASQYSTSTAVHNGLGGLANGDDATHHTATAGSMASLVTSGTASSACTDCHAATLLTAHATTSLGTAVSCSSGGTGNVGCHNSTALSTAPTRVKDNWNTNNRVCADCHTSLHNTIGTSHTGTSTLSCGGTGVNCHGTYDLVTLHKGRADGCKLSGCHDAANKNKRPSAKSCGSGNACHTAYTTSTTFPTHTNSLETTDHAPSTGNTAQEAATWTVGGSTLTCGACHLVTKTDGGLLTEHSLSSSAMTTNGTNVCRNCHNNPAAAVATAISTGWAANKDTSSACLQCHTAAAGLGIHADQATAKHTITTNTGCGNTGAGCHPTNDLSQVGTPSIAANIHSTCLRCHDHTASGGNMAYNPANTGCGSGRNCHATASQYNTSTAVHNGLGGLANGDDTTHHTATAGSMASLVTSGTASSACTDCHAATLLTAHATTSLGTAVSCSSGGTGNVGCHNSTALSTAPTRVKDNWNTNNRVCADCHTSLHNTIGTSHTGTSTLSCGNSGNGCHNTYDLVTLHKGRADGCKLSGCHDATNKNKRPAAKSCGSGNSCHTSHTATTGHGWGVITGNESTHTAGSMTATEGVYSVGKYDDSRTCATCHSAALVTEHTGTSVGTVGCTSGGTGNTGCHNQSTPVNGVNVIKNTNWQSTKLCTDCHGGTNGPAKHNAVVTGHVGVHTGYTCSDPACHATTDLRILHATKKYSAGCSQASDANSPFACHNVVGTTPTQKTCGSGNGGCHQDKTNTNHGGDHDADKAVGTAAGTSGFNYGYGTNVGCFGCHYSDLREEHGPTTFPDGPDGVGAGRTMDGGNGGTNGCGVCHSAKGTPGTYSTATAVTNAITKKDHRCIACHTNTAGDVSATKLVAAPHQLTASVTGSIVKGSADPLVEFKNWPRGGGHNAVGLYYPKSTVATFNAEETTGGTIDNKVNGITLTTAWPTTSLSGGLAAGWTTSSMVLCSDCHSWGAAPTGPQGAAAMIEIDPNYSQTEYGAATMSAWTATGTSRVVCWKCHTGVAGTAPHNNHSGRPVGSGGACTDCHTAIPHAWKRPRLLRRTYGGTLDGVAADAAPYIVNAGTGGLAGWSFTASAPQPSKGTCYVTCGASGHGPTTGTFWP